MHFPIPSSWSHDQVLEAAKALEPSLAEKHKHNCKWMNVCCPDAVCEFPKQQPSILLASFKERCAALRRLERLPTVSIKAVLDECPPRVKGRIQRLSNWESDVDAASGSEYTFALRLIALFGWHVQHLSYVVEMISPPVQRGPSPVLQKSPSGEQVHVTMPESARSAGAGSLLLHCASCGVNAPLWRFASGCARAGSGASAVPGPARLTVQCQRSTPGELRSPFTPLPASTLPVPARSASAGSVPAVDTGTPLSVSWAQGVPAPDLSLTIAGGKLSGSAPLTPVFGFGGSASTNGLFGSSTRKRGHTESALPPGRDAEVDDGLAVASPADGDASGTPAKQLRMVTSAGSGGSGVQEASSFASPQPQVSGRALRNKPRTRQPAAAAGATICCARSEPHARCRRTTGQSAARVRGEEEEAEKEGEQEEETLAFHPIKQHRSYCAWVRGQAADTSPGWISVLETVMPREDDELPSTSLLEKGNPVMLVRQLLDG
ncbi:hypothetical protein CYMTET_6972 [Cymbomonas tetramitiformis]|uniref:C3HC-type domain-containing protein n=1 Tax=Cymbomonas tetramitiformis TaxID=36881 RepID=A0AAE0LHH2_9CHLO|nr:hypothetical protein CYMTET_6972 [Cymbomonas tetramitiformis]